MGAMTIRDATNALRSVAGVVVRDAGNVKRTLSAIKMRDAGNVLRTVWSAMEVTASAPSVKRTSVIKDAPSLQITTETVTVTPEGGVAPYTYAWSNVFGASEIVADSPTAASTTFSATLEPEDRLIAKMRCVVTDSVGATGSVEVGVTLHLVNLDAEFGQ